MARSSCPATKANPSFCPTRLEYLSSALRPGIPEAGIGRRRCFQTRDKDGADRTMLTRKQNSPIEQQTNKPAKQIAKAAK